MQDRCKVCRKRFVSGEQFSQAQLSCEIVSLCCNISLPLQRYCCRLSIHTAVIFVKFWLSQQCYIEFGDITMTAELSTYSLRSDNKTWVPGLLLKASRAW